MGIIYRGKERTPEEYREIRAKEAKEWAEIQKRSGRRKGGQGTPTPVAKPDVKPHKQKEEGEVTGMVTVKHVNEMLNGKDDVQIKKEVLSTDTNISKPAPCKGRVCKPTIKENIHENIEGEDALVGSDESAMAFVDIGEIKIGEDKTVEVTMEKDEDGNVQILSVKREKVIPDEMHKDIQSERKPIETGGSDDNVLTMGDVVDAHKKGEINLEFEKPFSLKESIVGELPSNVAEEIEKNVKVDLQGKTYKQLVKIAQDLSIPAYGKKSELVDRIVRKQLGK